MPNAGWFDYVPYASRAYNPGLNIDFYALTMLLLAASTTVGSIRRCGIVSGRAGAIVVAADIISPSC